MKRMLMKRLLPLLALLCLGLSATGCTRPGVADYYEDAQFYLGAQEYESAAALFAQLGEYRDSADYALYCQALQAIADEEYDLARANLTAIAPFKSSERCLAWLDALALEEDGRLEEALAAYEALGTFANAHQDAERLRKAIPEAAVRQGRELMAKGEYAAAKDLFLSLDGYGQSEVLAKSCQNALDKAAYQAAEELLQAGDAWGALAAFQAMGDTLDAAKRADECTDALLTELDKQYQQVTVESARALIDQYRALTGHGEAQARADELEARYGRNSALLTGEAPYVLLGAYPGTESGAAYALLWRVLRVEGAQATLLCETIIDAAPTATSTDLLLTEAESAALLESTLPAASDLAALTDPTCPATPYAIAQGTQHADGLGVYWLRDTLENGLHPVISTTGALTLPEADEVPGIRPVISISLEDIRFTQGSGTPDDPFRAE